MTNRSLTAVMRFIAVIVAATMGCSASENSSAKEETSHLRLLTNVIARSSRELGRDPASEQELKAAIDKMGLSLQSMKVASIDELFVSERDGQPFVIVYGSSPQGVAAYEQTGINGKRQVGFKLGNIEEVDEARFAELVPGGTK
jgi:hypothetical protein